jgi:hypothetical protein
MRKMQEEEAERQFAKMTVTDEARQDALIPCMITIHRQPLNPSGQEWHLISF